MGPFEKVRRRNQEYLLIETLKRIGVSNYSLLARMTGLNPETVRYKVNTQLAKYGLGIQVNLNHAELGMSVGLLVVDAGRNGDWTEDLSYLLMEGKVMGESRYACAYAVPLRFKKKYMDILNHLKRRGKIASFEALEAAWVRYPTFRSEHYSFDERRWAVDWKKIEDSQAEVGYTFREPNPKADVDYFDLKILRAMQDNPTVNLTRVAAMMNANARTVRYHHAQHVVEKRLVLNSNVRWDRPRLEGRPEDLVKMVAIFRGGGQDGVVAARKLMNGIPFTWLEAGTSGGAYFALLDSPMEYFYDVVRHIESRAEGMKTKFSLLLLDAKRSRQYNLPDEMFDPKRGWTLPGYSQEMAGEEAS